MNIVIVGGGTAGWITAYFLYNAQPKKHNIIVLESSKIGIIGAGEGSTGMLVNLMSAGFFPKKIDFDDFMKKTNSTIKMGIRHTNWSKNKRSYFAPLDGSPTSWQLDDYIFKYSLAKFGKNKVHLASKIGLEYETQKYQNVHALHFDGFQVGKYFKNLCVEENVRYLDAIVLDAKIDEDGFMKSVVLDNGQELEADLFFDCSGFERILMKKMNDSWISYKKYLPLNTAMPFIVKWKDNEKIPPETNAHALNAGWMFTIPLTSRKGCGYIYDSNFLTKEQAQKEIELFLGQEIQPIKYINFDSGHSENFWKKNVVCLGLSSSFVEPLEATSIHNTIVQLSTFVTDFLVDNFNETFKTEKQNLYNKRIKKLMNLTMDFISLHYQGGREDTEFWRYIKNDKIVTENANQLIQFAKNKIPGAFLLDGMWGSYSIPLANWILSGIEIINETQAYEDLMRTNSFDIAEKNYKLFYDKTIEEFDRKKYIKWI